MSLAFRQTPHDMLPRPSHDEDMRQDFVLSLRQHLSRHVSPGSVTVYEKRVKPAFEKEHGRAPKDGHEVRKVMTRDPTYQLWSFMQGESQRQMWASTIDTVERTLPETLARARGKKQLGSLTLDPGLPMPRYHTAYDIHQQPGGYHSDFADGDLAEGLVYDLSVPIYAMGMMGPENDASGETCVNYFKTRFPGRSPARVLDMGCTIGNSSVPWAKHFPTAEVYAIDVGAPCLRYGHARANAMGHAVHFSQQNAERTSFPDDYFDVVTSSLMFHETSTTAAPAIFKECHRLLKPGGVMVHWDAWRTETPEPIREFLGAWEAYNNNEQFLVKMLRMDHIGNAVAAGFARDKVRIERTPYMTKVAVNTDKNKGYMGSFGPVPVFVAEK
ncbi:MAG: class I SAM-dependent methyltransferase [Rhodospirillaceae bacterium]|nr:class I SAM-dependent methyltransferase [Rhodospirillaceae bacterium]